MDGSATPAAPAKENFRDIPWNGYEASCPVCHVEVEWVAVKALYDRIRASDYPGTVELRTPNDNGILGGIQQEVFVVGCPNAPSKTVFFHYRQLFNRKHISDAQERKKSHPATTIPDPIYSFQEGPVSAFIEELRNEPNALVRDRVVRRLRAAGIAIPAV